MENLSNLLKKKGYKATGARLAIIEIFSRNKKPLDAKSITKKLVGEKINEVTVYRTLDSFEKAGILKKVDLRKDSTYYELSQEHHHHIVCTSCDKIEEFENQKLEKIIKELKSSKFRNIKEHSLELFGLCMNCA